MKFHAIAISSIVGVILLVFFLQKSMNSPTGPSGDGGGAATDRAIVVSSASWGLNCNRYIEYRNQTGAKKQGFQPTPLIVENNVLNLISQSCGGKQKCEFQATDKAFNTQRVKSCAKRLEITYRCFEYDRPWEVEASPRNNVVLDCTDK